MALKCTLLCRMLHAKLTNSYESTHVHAYGESCKMIIIINYHCDPVTVLNSKRFALALCGYQNC